jgi:hypothetical protein
MCTVAFTATSMSTQSNEEALKRSLEYTYYATPTSSPTMATTASYTPTATSYLHHRSHHHQQHHGYMHHQYPSHPTSQYYEPPLSPYPLPHTTHDAFAHQQQHHASSSSASSTTSTSAPMTTSYTEMLAISIGDSDFDDVRMLQEMLLTPHPVENRDTSHATLFFQSPYSRAQVGMPAMGSAGTRMMTPRSDGSSHGSPNSTPSHASRLVRTRGRAQRKIPSARICRVPECNKGIRSRGLCKAHGGGRRCQTPGCTISDQGGGHCIAHGGGKRCTVGGCEKSAQFKGLCKVHGGSRRCRVVDCDKNGQIKGLCRQHYTQSVQDGGDDF